MLCVLVRNAGWKRTVRVCYEEGEKMRVKAVRLYGKNDLRLDDIDLREPGDDEIRVRIVTDSICMSSYKAAIQGSDHKRVPDNLTKDPIVIGHEFAGIIDKVGKKWSGKYNRGDHFTIQPNINYLGKGYAPGYSFTDFGGGATACIIPGIVMEKDCLLGYGGDSFFKASLAEPISCLIAAFRASYHLDEDNKTHVMGIKPGGNLAILAGCGPMGLGAIDIAISMERHPKTIVVTDIDQKKIDRARSILSEEMAGKRGVKLCYLNTAKIADPVDAVKRLSGGALCDDVFVMAPVTSVVEMGVAISAKDGCVNFFSGPADVNFGARVNFYDVHYKGTHYMGTSGGDADDLREALRMIERQKINPAVMVTHIGGLNAVADTTLRLPHIPGGKKLIYTNLDLDLTAIEDFREKGKTDDMFKGLYEICSRHNMLWSPEAERFLLENAETI